MRTNIYKTGGAPSDLKQCEEQQIYYNLLTNIEKQRNNENDNYIYITGASRGLKHKSEYHNKWIIIRLQTSKLKKQKT